MFGLFKKPCEHKKRLYTGMTLSQSLQVVNTNIEGEIQRPVYLCEDCRVLFTPLDKEKIDNVHEATKN